MRWFSLPLVLCTLHQVKLIPLPLSGKKKNNTMKMLNSTCSDRWISHRHWYARFTYFQKTRFTWMDDVSSTAWILPWKCDDSSFRARYRLSSSRDTFWSILPWNCFFGLWFDRLWVCVRASHQDTISQESISGCHSENSAQGHCVETIVEPWSLVYKWIVFIHVHNHNLKITWV